MEGNTDKRFGLTAIYPDDTISDSAHPIARYLSGESIRLREKIGEKE